MTQIQNLRFREATIPDQKAIIDIHNSCVRGQHSSEDRGFLLAKTDEDELVKNLNSKTQYFIAVAFNDEVVGFLAISRPKISEPFLNHILWQDDSCKSKILSDRHIYIQNIATQRDYMGKGIARFLYQSLYEIFPNSVFSTFVVTKPILNQRSILFHEKQGFQQVGTIKHDQFLDLKNYESVLLFKEL